jgi:hypothetical protein
MKEYEMKHYDGPFHPKLDKDELEVVLQALLEFTWHDEDKRVEEGDKYYPVDCDIARDIYHTWKNAYIFEEENRGIF